MTMHDHLETPDPERLLTLDGTVNFRDIGGYPTSYGRRVAWRKLFRADGLDELSQRDLDLIEELGVRTVYDLRHTHERQRRPDRLPVHVTLRSADDGFNPDLLFVGLKEGHIGPDELHGKIRDMYRLFPIELVAEFRPLILDLLDRDAVPLLIHCASGKDRTGFAAAVILLALGVSRDTILDDYMLSNDRQRDLSSRFGPHVDPAIIAVMQGVHRSYLQSAFEKIDEQWQSDEIFLKDMLGIGTSEKERLIELLVN